MIENKPGTGDTENTWKRSRQALLYEVAEVYRDLLMLKSEKDLSFGKGKC